MRHPQQSDTKSLLVTTTVLIALGALIYLAVTAATTRLIAWDSQRRGTREEDLHTFGILGEVLPGLAWPIVLPILLALALLTGLHKLATKGIEKPPSDTANQKGQ